MVQKDMRQGIVQLIRKAETELPKDVVVALRHAYELEKGIAKTQLEVMLKNIDVARKTGRPICQDTGVQTFFVKVGLDFPHINILKDLITGGVKKATVVVPLRPNNVDPFTGKNHEKGDSWDDVLSITWDFVKGSDAVITAFPKGGGSENMSKLKMFEPSAGIEGVKDFVVSEMIKAGGNPCPPTVVGVGIGGGADLAMKLGKMALLRPIGVRHKDKTIAKMEEELIRRINKSGIGPMGLGGKTTVLDVHIEKAHRHPASLPVGLVVQCWAARKADMVIHADGTFEVK